MQKKMMLALVCILFFSLCFAVEIDTNLLESAKPVSYIEDTNPVSLKEFNTGKQIRDMGRRLGVSIKAQEKTTTEPFANGAPSFKYSARRVYHSEYRPGADILFIANNATVGTTKCLFRIVSGYIEKAYNIPMEKADKIAEKVCWWNNNHFDDATYFSSNFNPLVMDSFSDKTNVIGLATSYKDWPGKTRIVIPLVFVKQTAPTASTPDNTSALQNEKSKSASESETNKIANQTNQNSGSEKISLNEENNSRTNPKSIFQTNSKKEKDAQVQDGANQKPAMPSNYKILFALLILAALLLIILLIKVIKEIFKR